MDSAILSAKSKISLFQILFSELQGPHIGKRERADDCYSTRVVHKEMIMAPQDVSNPLRVVTQRLSSTPSKQLPRVAPYLANTIAQYAKFFAAPSKEGQDVGGSESAVTVHKLKTQLSALLQDKNPEARYAAVILVKATVENGGWNVLQGVGSWVRSLIGILGVSDPSQRLSNHSKSDSISPWINRL